VAEALFFPAGRMAQAVRRQAAASAPGSVNGGVRLLLRAEGFVVLAASVAAYTQFGAGWGWFAALFLLPDVSFLAYLAGPRLGALAYNAAHSSLGGVGLGMYLCRLVAQAHGSQLEVSNAEPGLAIRLLWPEGSLQPVPGADWQSRSRRPRGGFSRALVVPGFREEPMFFPPCVKLCAVMDLRGVATLLWGPVTEG
jgi:hypothetical protein